MMKIETLWAEYRSGLQAFLRSKVSDPTEAEDLLQDILIKTHQHLPSLQSETSVKPWLYQIARRTIVDFYRHSGRQPDLKHETLWYEDDDPTASLEQSLSRCVLPFIQALNNDQAELLTAIDINGESQKTAAERLGLSYSTLKSRVQKARQNLRNLFENCCQLSFDKHGNVIDCDSSNGHCDNC